MRLPALRLLVFALLIGKSAFPQAVTNPANPTDNPNQINVSTGYLYLNKLHYAGTWSSSVAYNSQDLVIYSSLPYISLVAANLNNNPGSSAMQWFPLPAGAASASWGAITGTLSAQTDLQTALNGKQASLGYTAENTANKDANSGYAGLTSGGLLNAAEIPPSGASALGGVESKTCTNQVFTALSTAGAFTCATVTSASVDTSIAATGVDINTSNQVTNLSHVSNASLGTSAIAANAVTNAKLANTSTTVNGQTCTLGSTCTLAHAVYAQSLPGNPSATSSTTGVMMGLAGSFTPLLSGNILVTINGDVSNGSTGDGAKVQIRYGTSGAPSNGASLTGTTCGSLVNSSMTGVSHVSAFSLSCIIPAATLSTTLWIDTGMAATGGGTATMADVQITAYELP